MDRLTRTVWVLTLAGSAAICNGQTKVFNSNGSVNPGDVWDTVVVKGDETVVDMVGGQAGEVITMDSSTVNMSGGKVAQIRSYDSSSLLLSASSDPPVDVYCYGKSSIDLLGNAAVNIFAYGGVVNSRSQRATIRSFDAYRTAVANIFAGTVSSVELLGPATVNVSGGQVGCIYMDVVDGIRSDAARVQVTGGIVDGIWLELGAAVVRLSGGIIGSLHTGDGEYEWEVALIGHDLDVVPYGGPTGTGQATGFWADSTYFTIDFDSIGTYNDIKKYDDTVPPDCMEEVAGDLNEDCLVNFADFAVMAANWLATVSL